MHRLQTAPNHRWSSCWSCSWSWLWLIDDDHHTGFITVWLILNIIPRLPGCYTRQEITHLTLVKPPGSNNKKKHQGAWSWFWNCIYFCFLFQSSWFQYLFLRGIATNLFTTHWSIPEWQAEINVRWQIFEYSDINIFKLSNIPNTVTSIARLAMCFLFRYHCAPFCFRYYWSNTDKWQSSSGTGKSVPIRSSFVAFTIAIKSMQMSPNVIFFHQMWAWGPCSVTRHWSRHWNSGNDRLPGLLWGVLFQLSQCPHVLTYSFFFDGSYSKLPLFSARSPSPRGWPWCWLPRCPLASDPSCRSRTWSAPAGPWTGSFNQFLTPLSEWQRMSGWWITKSVEVFFWWPGNNSSQVWVRSYLLLEEPIDWQSS